MKRKVKKYAGGTLVDSSGNPVRSGSGEVVRTRFGKDDEDRPKSSGVEDYETMGKRAGATSPFSGPKEYISESSTEDTEKETKSPKGIASGFKFSESKFERNDNEEKMPVVKKKSIKKADAKPASQSFPTRDRDRADQTFPIRGASDTKKPSAIGKALDRATDVAGVMPGALGLAAVAARTRAGTVVPGRTEPSEEDKSRAMSSLADRIRKQDQESSFSFKPNKSPNRSYKSGGKTTKMASGGKTSSASSRGDGIAQRGKTKGRIC